VKPYHCKYGELPAYTAADHQTARPILMNQIVKGADGKPTYAIGKIMACPDIIPPVDPACKT
jgi:branched-chain amino acid transport system substrate-binding protein